MTKMHVFGHNKDELHRSTSMEFLHQEKPHACRSKIDLCKLSCNNIYIHKRLLIPLVRNQDSHKHILPRDLATEDFKVCVVKKLLFDFTQGSKCIILYKIHRSIF